MFDHCIKYNDSGSCVIFVVIKLVFFCILGVSRENFNIVINAKDYGFEPTDTPRTDRSVRFSGSLVIVSFLFCLALSPSLHL